MLPCYSLNFCGQSYIQFTTVIYDARAVPDQEFSLSTDCKVVIYNRKVLIRLATVVFVTFSISTLQLQCNYDITFVFDVTFKRNNFLFCSRSSISAVRKLDRFRTQSFASPQQIALVYRVNSLESFVTRTLLGRDVTGWSTNRSIESFRRRRPAT